MNSIAKIQKCICTGCGLCAVVCPKNAIIMEPDAEGFLQPVIHVENCVNCGLCLKGCPAEAEGLELERSEYFCCIAADEEMLLKSSSGGVFGILANYFLQMGGYVCGCVYDEKMSPVHLLSNRISDVQRMYGSKYVQSKCFDKKEQEKHKMEIKAKYED